MYANVAEIESALENLAAAYPTLCELFTPPNATHAGRTTYILRVGRRGAGEVDGVLLLGGVHAREWVPPDALVSLAADLLEAGDGGLGLGYGGVSFSPAQIATLLDTLNLFIFPCVNPDGRDHSQNVVGLWRKNRRPAPPGHPEANCHGVDLNRNFDFLWDHTTKFAANSGVRTSADPCDENVYRGPSAASEPETQNVVWALDTFPRIRWHIDVHSAVPVILHSWGTDQNQTSDPDQSFLNAACDAVRGRPDDTAYREFIDAADLDAVTQLSDRMNMTIQAVRGVNYGFEQAFGLYPTSGASDDYAFSRHFADPAKAKVYGFTIECGSEFQPPWAEAQEVIREVSAGLIAFCLDAKLATDGVSATL